MRKKEAFEVGNVVKVLEGIQVLDSDNNLSKTSEEYVGMVTDIDELNGEMFVEIDNKHEEFVKRRPRTSRDSVPSNESSGLYVKQKEAERIIFSEDEKRNKISEILVKLSHRRHKEKLNEIVSKGYLTEDLKRNIKYNEEQNEYHKKRLEETEKEIETQTKEADKYSLIDSIEDPELERALRQLDKIKKVKSADVEMFENGKVYLIVDTVPLFYKGRVENCYDGFELGSYKIRINLDGTEKIYAVNTSKVIEYSTYHPCISGGSICMGSQVQGELGKLTIEREFAAAIIVLINFLEEPNYGGPYLDIHYFSLAQKVTMKPRSNENWFNVEYWRAHNKFDYTKYELDRGTLDGGSSEEEEEEEDSVFEN